MLFGAVVLPPLEMESPVKFEPFPQLEPFPFKPDPPRPKVQKKASTLPRRPSKFVKGKLISRI